MLSQAVEDYLKTIYKLQGDDAVSTTDIARALGRPSQQARGGHGQQAPGTTVDPNGECRPQAGSGTACRT